LIPALTRENRYQTGLVVWARSRQEAYSLDVQYILEVTVDILTFIFILSTDIKFNVSNLANSISGI
jgi:hypothetical protein